MLHGGGIEAGGFPKEKNMEEAEGHCRAKQETFRKLRFGQKIESKRANEISPGLEAKRNCAPLCNRTKQFSLGKAVVTQPSRYSADAAAGKRGKTVIPTYAKRGGDTS